jgi:tetratricopeptide (TPR) repeat protein
MYRFKYILVLIFCSGIVLISKAQNATDSSRFKAFDSAAKARRATDTALNRQLEKDLNRTDLAPRKETKKFIPVQRNGKDQMIDDSLFRYYGEAADKNMLAKNYDSAIYYYGKQLGKNHDPAPVYFNRANAESFLNKFELAVKDFDSCLQYDSAVTNAYLSQGYIYMKMNKVSEALESYSKALKTTNDSSVKSNTYLSLANAYLNIGKLAEAENDFTNAIKYNAGNWQGWFQRAAVRRRLTKDKLALTDINKANSLKPNDPDVLLLKGVTLFELGSYKEAITSLNASLKIRKFDDGYFFRGSARLRLGQDSLAREDFNKILASNKKHIGALNGRAEANFKLKHYTLALKDNTSIIELAPNTGEAYANRAYIYTVMKDIDKACKDWHKAKDLGVPKADEALQKVCGGK